MLTTVGKVGFCRASLALVAGTMMLGLGCYRDDSESRGLPPPTEAKSTLTSELARAALVSMITSLPENDPTRSTLDAVKNRPARSLQRDRIGLGPWDCDLRGLRFSYVLDNPPVFFLVEGNFVREEGGTWKAVVTRTVRN